MCDISIAICTLNRSDSLKRAVTSITAQEAPGARCEIIVVDNGSTDRTRETVEALMAESAIDVRYVFESRRGLAYARNAAIRASRSPIVAFTDDDQTVAPDWVRAIRQSFEQHPDIAAVGGRVCPVWPCEPPAWVQRTQSGPLALVDRGREPFYVNTRRWMCLPGGNSACRRAVLEELGGYHSVYPRSQDREFQVRLLQAGGQALYQPDMVAYHHIEPGRLTKAYFRQWHRTEGRMRAGYRFEELFDRTGEMWPAPVQGRSAFGVSGFVYRMLADEIVGCARALAGRRFGEAFGRETRAIYLASYIARRWSIRKSRTGARERVSVGDLARLHP